MGDLVPVLAGADEPPGADDAVLVSAQPIAELGPSGAEKPQHSRPHTGPPPHRQTSMKRLRLNGCEFRWDVLTKRRYGCGVSDVKSFRGAVVRRIADVQKGRGLRGSRPADKPRKK